jgi:hypothetical protein
MIAEGVGVEFKIEDGVMARCGPSWGDRRGRSDDELLSLCHSQGTGSK